MNLKPHILFEAPRYIVGSPFFFFFFRRPATFFACLSLSSLSHFVRARNRLQTTAPVTWLLDVRNLRELPKNCYVTSSYSSSGTPSTTTGLPLPEKHFEICRLGWGSRDLETRPLMYRCFPARFHMYHYFVHRSKKYFLHIIYNIWILSNKVTVWKATLIDFALQFQR